MITRLVTRMVMVASMGNLRPKDSSLGNLGGSLGGNMDSKVISRETSMGSKVTSTVKRLVMGTKEGHRLLSICSSITSPHLIPKVTIRVRGRTRVVIPRWHRPWHKVKARAS